MCKGFRPYMHIEKFGNDDVLDIQYGECYVFPKIDGTNSSVWVEDGVMNFGSRRRHLTAESKDNQGFREYASSHPGIASFLAEFPGRRLFGEWLVPHTLKDYTQSAWRKFYVFDVAVDTEDGVEYIPYESYMPDLKRHGIDFIPPLVSIENASYERLLSWMERNFFLLPDGGSPGEGIVIKNYGYKNKYNRTVWAKLVRSEFKTANVIEMGAPRQVEAEDPAFRFVSECCTEALIEKSLAKIKAERGGWNSKNIPELLGRVFHDLVNEELWSFIKAKKNPAIDFKSVNALCIQKIKTTLPQIF